MKIIAGSGSRKLAESLARATGMDLVNVEIRRFPDGEVYVRILDELNGEDVAIVQTTYPDGNIIELFALQDAARDEIGDGKILTIVPYYGYSRQDKKFNPGEPITARAMMRHIELYSDGMIFVDLHAPSILDWASKPRVEVHAGHSIADYFIENKIHVDFVLSPDKGAIQRAARVAERLGVEFDHLEKTRIDGTTVKMAPKNLDVHGKDVVIVDDIIATGGTIIKATEQLKSQGAFRVYAACTHGLYTGGAIPKLKNVLDGLYSTDTLESETSVITVADSVARGIKEITKEW